MRFIFRADAIVSMPKVRGDNQSKQEKKSQNFFITIQSAVKWRIAMRYQYLNNYISIAAGNEWGSKRDPPIAMFL